MCIETFKSKKIKAARESLIFLSCTLGHPRATFDLDLLIPRSAAGKWRAVLSKLQYQLFAESANFHQYEAPQEFPLPPVDLMLVDDDVFLTIERTKSETQPIATPSVQAMIALKLHAINQPGRDNAEKDWADVLALVKADQLTLDDPDTTITSGINSRRDQSFAYSHWIRGSISDSRIMCVTGCPISAIPWSHSQ